MKKLLIRSELCPQNHKCPAVNICPIKALQQKDYNAPIVEDSKCIKCGKCVNFCPHKVFSLIEN